MLSILVVEDDRGKLQRILQCIISASDLTVDAIDTCLDANSAKKFLRQKAYDLLVVDIAIPDRADADVSRDGGTRLLHEISTRSGYQKPDHIIGITAYEDIAQLAQEQFRRRSWNVIQYDVSSESWSEVLRDKVVHIARARESLATADTTYHSDLCVVCALDDPELISVRNIDWGWKIEAVPLDHTIYYRGKYVNHGASRVVHAAAAPRMGMPAAAVLAMKMIAAFRPRYLALVGITAGVGDVNLGDVVAAEVCWDYGSGKYKRINGQTKFQAAPHQIQIAPELRTKLQLLSENYALLASVRENWPGEKPSDALKMHLGPMASGAAVLADHDKTEAITEQHRKVAAIEMEAYGVFVAAEECASPRPEVFSLKSITDLADSNKNDQYKRYASYTSAQMLKHFVEEYL